MPTYFMLPTTISRGDYGQWTAFLALLVRLFFFIPGRVANMVNIRVFMRFFLSTNNEFHTLFLR